LGALAEEEPDKQELPRFDRYSGKVLLERSTERSIAGFVRMEIYEFL
jgi:hypothetical protein